MDHKDGGKQPQPKKTGVAGFGTVADNAQDKEKTDKNNYYAGGHSSGMAVVGGPNNNEPHRVERLQAGAKQAGAVVDEHKKAEVPKFAGSGQSLSGVAVEGAPLPPKQVVRVLSMYDDGFTVDDGPFRPFADAANAAFLQDVEQGTVPRELEREAAQQGAQLQVDLVDKRGQKYEPPKNARPPVKAFVGSGHSLSAPPAQPPLAVASSTASLVVDSSQPTTRVQFRGSDGSRVVGTFNETHTVAQCLSWLSSQRGGAAIRSASVAGPPARTLEAADYLLTLQQAQLKDSVLFGLSPRRKKMPGYHSEWNEANQPTLCGMGVTPINTKFKGPAPTNVPKDKPDIIDEALRYFKANVLFRNFELLGAADKTLVYLTLFISEALQKLGNQDIESAKKEMYTLSIQEFWVPGHANWPLAGFTTAPASRAEQEQVRQWMAQLRQECGVRLCELVFAKDKNKPDKWWMCFKTKKFMNKTLYDEGRK